MSKPMFCLPPDTATKMCNLTAAQFRTFVELGCLAARQKTPGTLPPSLTDRSKLALPRLLQTSWAYLDRVMAIYEAEELISVGADGAITFIHTETDGEIEREQEG